MYEDQTYEVILDRMLNRVTSHVDKREGSIIWDALAPAAKELELCYQCLDLVIKQAFPSTADRDFLLEFASMFNIEPNEATPATVEAEIIMNDGSDVPVGTRFSHETIYFIVTEKIAPNRYYMDCETPGTIGNNCYGLIQPVNFNGVKHAEIIGLIVPGIDIEDTESFRERLQSHFQDKAYGGNIADYKQKVNSITGVGGTKVIRTPHNQVLYVDLYIIDNQFKKPTDELVSRVQEEIHPLVPAYTQTILENSGDGVSPIGHIVTVHGVRERVIDVQLNLAFMNGYTYERLRETIEESIKEYFLNILSRRWADRDNITVQISGVENAVYNISGILDIQNTSLNYVRGNLVLDFDEIPVLGKIEYAPI